MRASIPLLALLLAGPAAGVDPVADVHLHYKWNQAEVTSPRQAVQALAANDVRLAVVTGTPPELALELTRVQAPGVTVLPVYGPYRQPADWDRWYRDPGLLERARTALATGEYHGIGELHVIAGFAPDWRSPVIRGLIDLALDHDVPFLLHTEASRPEYLIDLCRGVPELRILWAHAGAILPVAEVRRAMAACPNLWVELSARDPWRYVATPIADDAGRLLPEWERLVLDHPDRFMIGSDAVWPVEQLNPWDEPDTGWRHLDRFLDFHRGWLAALPPEVAERVALTNALRFFRVGD